MNDVDLNLAGGSLLPPIDEAASCSTKEQSVGTKHGDWKTGLLNSKIDTSLT